MSCEREVTINPDVGTHPPLIVLFKYPSLGLTVLSLIGPGSPYLLLNPRCQRMIPRTTSIFHVGEEGAGEAAGAATRGRIWLESSRLDACERLQGLRILIQHSGRQRSNVVINSSLKYSSCMAASAPPFGLFLKACLWCRKEPSPHVDVYMYRYNSHRFYFYLYLQK